jgi:MFS transporter, PAT family, beta-lactamase induction signal transducer AmpG
MVDGLGWPTFFLFTVAAALPGLALLYWFRTDVIALDAPSPAPKEDPT